MPCGCTLSSLLPLAALLIDVPFKIDFALLKDELVPDDWKSLAFQIAQTLCLCRGEGKIMSALSVSPPAHPSLEIFTKSDVCRLFPELAPFVRRAPSIAQHLPALNHVRDLLISPLLGALEVHEEGDLTFVGLRTALPPAMRPLEQELRHGVVMDRKRERVVCYHSRPDGVSALRVVSVWQGRDDRQHAYGAVLSHNPT